MGELARKGGREGGREEEKEGGREGGREEGGGGREGEYLRPYARKREEESLPSVYSTVVCVCVWAHRKFQDRHQ